MKIFKHHSIMRCIYGILIALPMFAILGRVIYTQSNKNAKDSYYGETINQENIFYTSDLQVNNFYEINLTPTYTQSVTDRGFINKNIYFTDMSVTNRTYDFTQYSYFAIYVNTDNTIEVFVFKSDGTYLDFYITRDNLVVNFKYLYQSPRNGSYNIDISNDLFVGKSYNKYSYLDNAFDYSLSRFVDDNHWGKLNFFEWFSSLFIDINSNNNALYMHFVNWYMNYVMFVSCAYILFMVLMWFINFSRRVLERGMNYDW